MKWEAGLRGVNLDKKIKEKEKEKGVLFRDPADYERMTEEERQETTKKMMEGHKMMFNMPGGGK